MSDIQEALNKLFRHKVGDLVVPRFVVEAIKAEARINTNEPWGRIGGPNAGVVGEREVRECHGGVQGFYLVYEKAEGAVAMHRYPEHALVSFAEAEAALTAIAPKPKDVSIPDGPSTIEAAQASVERLRMRLAAAELRVAELEKKP